MEEDGGRGTRPFSGRPNEAYWWWAQPSLEKESCAVTRPRESTERNFNCFTLSSKSQEEVSMPSEEKEVL